MSLGASYVIFFFHYSFNILMLSSPSKLQWLYVFYGCDVIFFPLSSASSTFLQFVEYLFLQFFLASFV